MEPSKEQYYLSMKMHHHYVSMMVMFAFNIILHTSLSTFKHFLLCQHCPFLPYVISITLAAD